MMAHAGHQTMEMGMSSSDHGMSHENMSASSECCERMWGNCETNMHECCMSPFTDSAPTSFASHVKNDNDLDNAPSDLDAILHENLLQTSIEKLNSPPSEYWSYRDFVYSKSQYHRLIWIIRNNA